MTIILEPHTIPEKGKVKLKVGRSFTRGWLRDEVSMLIDADLPNLVVGDQVVWQVPAWIGFPHMGCAGIVGTVDVDVTTGTMNNTPECKGDIERQAESVAARQPPYRPKDNVPEQYLAKNVRPAPKLRILEDAY